MANFDTKILASNIISEEEIRKYTELVLTHLNDSLARSAGPFGKTSIVLEGYEHSMTKDGNTILKNIKFNDIIMNIILKIIKESSSQLVMKVGDGSTASVLASNELYRTILTIIEKHGNKIRSKQIMDTLNRCIDNVIEEIKTMAIPLSKDMHELGEIAAVSLNNDMQLGEMIGKIYKDIGKDGFINVKLGNSISTYSERAKGFQIDFGYLDKVLVNTELDECKIKNSNILMFDSVLTEDYRPALVQAVNDTNSNGEQRSLTIIAPAFSANIQAFLRDLITYNYIDKNVVNNINVIKFPLGTEFDSNLFDDLAIMINARPIKNSLGDIPEKEQVHQHFGFAGEVISTYKITSFTGVNPDKNKIDTRIGNLKNELEKLNDSGSSDFMKKYELQKRLAILEEKLYTIIVGGNSEDAKKADKFLFDDAVAACKSAIEHGYVLGCNLSIPIAIDNILRERNLIIDEKMEDVEVKVSAAENELEYDIYNAIKDAFYGVFKTIYLNKYADTEENLKMIETIFNECVSENKVYDLIHESYSTKIINSAETEIEILRNVISIISLILLSNQFVTVNPETQIK